MTALAVPHAAAFAAELANSVASLALSRAGQPPADQEPGASWEWEQRVVDGHPYHPNCRSRPGFSVAEQLAYGPEHRPVVELGLVAVGRLPRDGRVAEVAAGRGARADPGPSLAGDACAGRSGQEGAGTAGGLGKEGGLSMEGLRQEGFARTR